MSRHRQFTPERLPRPRLYSFGSGWGTVIGELSVRQHPINHMKSFLPLVARRGLLLALLALPLPFACGCTPALWDKETFAHHYRPGSPANLRLSYSTERQDILVQYDESKDGDTTTRPRCYWLDPNTLRVNRNQKPHFVSAKAATGLAPIPVGEGAPGPRGPGLKRLYARVTHEADFFTLYSGTEQLDPYKLPQYTGSSQRVKQVLLTPFAVAVDATIVGAVMAYWAAPGIFAGLSR